jgi:hypothetical protein
VSFYAETGRSFAMKKSVLIALIVALLLCIGTVAAIVLNQNQKEDIDELSVIHPTYCIDVNNYDELVAYADYVFVGVVLSIGDADYRDITQSVIKDGSFEDIPCTELHVIVDENIKGTMDDLILYKSGGIGMDQKTTYIYEDDMMPQKGEKYIFFGSVQKDGSLLISGANSNIAFSEDALKQIKESASKNPEFSRQRYQFSDLYCIEVDYYIPEE